jgi:hypothetical protein
MPRPAEVPAELRVALAQSPACQFGPCTLVWQPGATEAVAVGFPCERCDAGVVRFSRDPAGGWRVDADVAPSPPAGTSRSPEVQQRSVASGAVEVRPVQRRQVFVEGRPVGPVF